MNQSTRLPGKWYVSIPIEARPLVGPGAGPFETEQQARDWLLCLPLIKGAAIWRHTWADRRSAPRHAAACGTAYHLTDDHEIGLVWNVSEGGAGLVVREPLPEGTALRAELKFGGVVKSVTGRVRHVVWVADGFHFIGCKFDARMANSDLDLGPRVRQGRTPH
jgi:hypothetical protein